MKDLPKNVHTPAPTTPTEIFEPSDYEASKKIIVIGAGPVGIRFCAELLKRRPDSNISVFGNEPSQPYNRVQLSSLLAGDIPYDDILTQLPEQNLYPNFSNAVRAIHGNQHRYDKLVIATGSRPHTPNIPGIEQTGVYTFRSIKDAEFLYSRMSRARHVVVVGGGLLGIESAKALLRSNTQVTLVQQGPRLMNRQLDDDAASQLQDKVTSLGIRVITNSGVRKILGEGRVSGIETRDKEHIACDTVLICAGIKANVEIARDAKIKISRGILVDDNLATSVKDIYSIGECCEHRGSTYGLVNPGYEQAAILADRFCAGSASYSGSLEITRLKVLGETVCSMGAVTDIEKRPFLNEFTYKHTKTSCYRKIVTYKGRLIGAVGFGDWKESRRVQEVFQHQRRVWPWQVAKFLITGNIFTGGQQDDISSWPSSAIVCQCNNISQGELVEAVACGHNTLEKIHAKTLAGTVCGSCKPLLSQLIGYTGPTEKEKGWLTTLIASLLAITIAAAITLLPGLTVSDSVQSIPAFETIWNDKFWKQVTGFSLLGLSTIGLLMSLRKRIKNKKIGEYAYWRILHVVVGVFCASTLVLHTGLHLGSNFNQILMLDFLAILILGSLAGAVFSISHNFSANTAKKIRSFWTWIHIFFTWPLPILLGFHILTVYYF